VGDFSHFFVDSAVLSAVDGMHEVKGHFINRLNQDEGG
jgi:hypothetical protein